MAAPKVWAEQNPSSAAFWRSAAEADVEAAARLISDDHPAMVPEVGDRAFRAAFEEAHKLAAERARAVGSAAGYAATLSGFAVALGDKHIQSRPTMLAARPKWAGIIVAKRGNRWLVVDEDTGPANTLVGSELASCDGKPVDEFARASLGTFKVDWNVGAQQVQSAPWLLIDEGNPFINYPESCSFVRNGNASQVALQWSPIARDRLVPRIDRAVRGGAAGFGVRPLGRGQVIALQSLNQLAPSVEQVVQEVQAKATKLRASPYILIDLRGNSGGNSLYGRRIANILLGKEHVESILGDPSSDCYEVWRVSAANIATLRNYQKIGAQMGDKHLLAIVDKMLADALTAQARGKQISGSTICDLVKRPGEPVASTYRGRLFILTDNRCFSSCLVLADDFRSLGATQLGEATDANPHYTQVRHEPMPSGLSTFSTQQAISPGSPDRPELLGPFVPHIAFDGDLADNGAVEAWLTKVIEGAEAKAD